MLKSKALKSEMAKAVLALGIAGATPVFAQDNNATPVTTDTETSPQTLVVGQEYRDWYNPEIPQNILFGLMLLAMAGTGYAVYRKNNGALLRAAALGVGFAAIVNPQNVVDEYRTLPTIIPVFVDKSQSVGDRAPNVEQAFKELETKLSSLGPVTIRRIEFGNDDESRAKPGTYFAGVLQSTMDSIPRDQFGGAFVISDGVVSDQSRFLNVKNITAPVNSLIVGHDQEEDFYVRIEEAPQIGIIGQEQEIKFRIVDGKAPDSKDLNVDVDLYYAGELVKTISVPVNQTQTLKISDLHDGGLELGQNLVEIGIRDVKGSRIPAMDRNGDGKPDEVTLENNRIITTIEGINSDIKVLLLSGAPYQGTRLWRDLLLKDSSVSLTHLAFIRPPLKEDATPLRDLATVAVPVKEVLHDKIGEFDMIIIDSYTYNGVIPAQYFNDIRQYVENGGSLLIDGAEALAAPNSLTKSPLGDILPLVTTETTVDQAFIPQISDLGARHPVGRAVSQAGNGGQWGPWYSLVDSTPRSGATVLMTDQGDRPLLALSYVGKGRVAELVSDQNAVWASGHRGGGPATTLYKSVTGWLTGAQRYKEENLTLRQSEGDIVIELQTMKDSAEPVIITSPSGKETEVTPEQVSPGLFVARIPADEKGAYSAKRKSSPNIQAYAGSGYADETEIQNVISNTEILRPLSDNTNGATVRVTDVSGALTMPAVYAANDTVLQNPDAPSDPVVVNMTEKKELVGSQRNPMIPGWLYALAFAGMLMYSFKPKDKSHKEWASSLLRLDRNKGPGAPSV